jgi:hypothetical protein
VSGRDSRSLLHESPVPEIGPGKSSVTNALSEPEEFQFFFLFGKLLDEISVFGQAMELSSSRVTAGRKDDAEL